MNKREVVITEISRNCQSVRLLGGYRDNPKETWAANVEVMTDKQLMVRSKLHDNEKKEADGDFVKIPDSIQEAMKQEARYILKLEPRPIEDSFEERPVPNMESLQMPLL